jgi:cobalt-zinc-cadmium resistance protein CzcA
LYENERKFPIVVRLPEEQRSDLNLIRTLPVGTGTNATAPLGQLAKTEFAQTFGSIVREDSNRRSAVLVKKLG